MYKINLTMKNTSLVSSQDNKILSPGLNRSLQLQK